MEASNPGEGTPAPTPAAILAEMPIGDMDLAVRTGRGPLGSEVLILECPDREPLEEAVRRLSKSFGRSWIDLLRGFAIFVTPSRRHDFTKEMASDLVRSLAACRTLPVARFGSGRWSTPSADGSTEPDASFYVGEVAVEYRRLYSRYEAWEVGEDELDEFEEEHPATLVLEVEHSHYAFRKRELCRRVGIAELWELGTRRARHKPAIVGLQGSGAPRELEASEVIPGVRPDRLHHAMSVLHEMGDYGDICQGLVLGDDRPERLLRAATILEAE